MCSIEVFDENNDIYPYKIAINTINLLINIKH